MTLLQEFLYLLRTAIWQELLLAAILTGLGVGIIRFIVTNIILVKGSGVKSELKKFIVFSGIGFIVSLALFTMLHFT